MDMTSKAQREPSTQPISKLEFEFKRKRLTKDDERQLVYRPVPMEFKSLFLSLINPHDRLHHFETLWQYFVHE